MKTHFLLSLYALGTVNLVAAWPENIWHLSGGDAKAHVDEVGLSDEKTIVGKKKVIQWGKVFSISPESISVMTDSGLEGFDVDQLPEDVRNQLGITPEFLAAYQDHKSGKAAVASIVGKQKAKIQAEQKAESDKRKAKQQKARSTKALVARRNAAIMKLRKNSIRIQLKVHQVLPDGVLAFGTLPKGVGGHQGHGKVVSPLRGKEGDVTDLIFVEGDFAKNEVRDGNDLVVRAARVEDYSYTTVTGALKVIPSYYLTKVEKGEATGAGDPFR